MDIEGQIVKINELKEKYNKKKEERTKRETEIKVAKEQLEELEKECKDKYGVSLDELHDFINAKYKENEDLISEIEEKLKEVE